LWAPGFPLASIHPSAWKGNSRKFAITEFYDLAKDPLEEHNLIARAGREDLARWRREVLEWHAQASAAYDRN
jgi:hypothetical protein